MLLMVFYGGELLYSRNYLVKSIVSTEKWYYCTRSAADTVRGRALLLFLGTLRMVLLLLLLLFNSKRTSIVRSESFHHYL